MYDDWDGKPLVLAIVMNGGARFGELVIRALNKICFLSSKIYKFEVI